MSSSWAKHVAYDIKNYQFYQKRYGDMPMTSTLIMYYITMPSPMQGGMMLFLKVCPCFNEDLHGMKYIVRMILLKYLPHGGILSIYLLFYGVYVTIGFTYITECYFTDTTIPDSKVHGANMGPTWVLSVADGPHVCPVNLAIRDPISEARITNMGNIYINLSGTGI